jgi:hypothetical protein
MVVKEQRIVFASPAARAFIGKLGYSTEELHV